MNFTSLFEKALEFPPRKGSDRKPPRNKKGPQLAVGSDATLERDLSTHCDLPILVEVHKDFLFRKTKQNHPLAGLVPCGRLSPVLWKAQN